MAEDTRRSMGFEFERFIADLLREYALTILEEPQQGRDRGYDLKIASTQETNALVEVKLYSSLHIASSTLRRAFARLKRTMGEERVERGIFVTNAQLTRPIKEEAKAQNIAVYDLDVLNWLVGDRLHLAERWRQLSQGGFTHRSNPLPPTEPPGPVEFINTGSGGISPPPSSPPPASPRPDEGAQLCTDLKSSKAGRGKAATRFEQLCDSALRYLFDQDLINWSPQKSTHSRLHRYDLIARISSQNDFWNSLITDHRSRYVIFEFKNYGNAITQSEIYSTEKYLLPYAMRGTAIIIARKGANRNAYKVMAGAMREAGKLILTLSLEQMCEMLHAKDKGDDPCEILVDELEVMLTGLER